MARAETPAHCSLSLQVVINGGATSSGEQDNEDTELMAIYTTENGIAEKVPVPGVSLGLGHHTFPGELGYLYVCFVMEES